MVSLVSGWGTSSSNFLALLKVRECHRCRAHHGHLEDGQSIPAGVNILLWSPRKGSMSFGFTVHFLGTKLRAPCSDTTYSHRQVEPRQGEPSLPNKP